jgi:hypothetical protein
VETGNDLKLFKKNIFPFVLKHSGNNRRKGEREREGDEEREREVRKERY